MAASSMWVLDHQKLTLWVAMARWSSQPALYVVIPKGFFPDQDTGLIQGVSEATEVVSYAAMAERQQALAQPSSRTRMSRACPRSLASTATT